MKVVVFEPDGEARVNLRNELTGLGCSVACFGDARMAFLYLLGRLHEVDGVVVNIDEPNRGTWLVRHLEVIPEPLSVVTYSTRERSNGAEIQGALFLDRPIPMDTRP